MRTAPHTLLFLTALATLGCNSEDTSEPATNPLLAAAEPLEGIYELTALHENADDCNSEGEDILAQSGTTHAYVRGASFFGAVYLEVVGCESVADCRETAESDIVISNHSYLMEQYDGSSFSGDGVFTGFGFDGVCEEPLGTHTEFTESGGSFELTQESAIGPDYPADDDGFCSTEGAEAAVAGAPCSALVTMRADFLEPL